MKWESPMIIILVFVACLLTAFGGHRASDRDFQWRNGLC